MEQRKVIGIDPDSNGFQCIFIKEGDSKVIKKYFYIGRMELQKFIKWVNETDADIIAIEGTNGQSRPIEKVLRENKIVFYSFKPADVDKYRRATLGENKNNVRDAEAAASFALALADRLRLVNFKRVWFPEDGLQLLTRHHEKITSEKTAEINSLWKLIRIASPDLYLLLKGKEKDVEDSKSSKLDNNSLLNLFFVRPDFSEWKDLTKMDLFEAMGGKSHRGVVERIIKIKKIANNISPEDSAISLLIKSKASHILFLKQQLKVIEQELKKKAGNNKAIQILVEEKGIGINTASKIVAEIVDIRRFAKDDNLASYTGLGRKTDDTGDTKNEKKNYFFNRRLKNALVTAAKNFVRFNPHHHLTGYFKYLVNERKRNMDKTEAYKRVARSLVRVIFKKLYGLIEIKDPIVELKKKEGGMANGKTRNTNVLSNIPPSSKLSLTENVKRSQTKK
jgi:transposase